MGRGFQPRFPGGIPNSVPNSRREGRGRAGGVPGAAQEPQPRIPTPKKTRGERAGGRTLLPHPPKFRVGSREGGEKGRRRLELGRADFLGGESGVGGGVCGWNCRLEKRLQRARTNPGSNPRSAQPPGSLLTGKFPALQGEGDGFYSL